MYDTQERKMSTLSEVAKRAGVSKTTVSRVLNNRPSGIPISEETRKKVLKAAKELNYYPNIFARSLRTKKVELSAWWYRISLIPILAIL